MQQEKTKQNNNDVSNLRIWAARSTQGLLWNVKPRLLTATWDGRLRKRRRQLCVSQQWQRQRCLLALVPFEQPACSRNKSKANKTMREHHVDNKERKNFSQQQANIDKKPTRHEDFCFVSTYSFLLPNIWLYVYRHSAINTRVNDTLELQWNGWHEQSILLPWLITTEHI